MFIDLHIFSELEQLQNEKRKALLEHETAKLRECDEALQRELRDWKSQLHPRKQVRGMANSIHSIRLVFFVHIYTVEDSKYLILRYLFAKVLAVRVEFSGRKLFETIV